MSELLKLDKINISRGQKAICRDLSFAIYPGDFYGLLGVNGRGKTTLLHTLANLIKPTSGQVFLEKENLSTIPRKRLARKMGLLLQEESHHFPITVQETLSSGRYAHGKREHALQDFEQILHLLNLKQYTTRNLLELSGGERRRVSIGRILFQQPSLYLLDEPITHLDPVYQQRVLTQFKNLCEDKGAAVLMAGHDVSLMRLFCNRFILLLENGETLIGSLEDVLTPPNLSAVFGAFIR